MARKPIHPANNRPRPPAPETLPPNIPDPDAGFEAAQQARIGKIGARRLAALSGAPERLLAGASIADLKLRLGHVIDPRWLFMQRICGEVVRVDPATGERLPVPFATVQVEDTDCSFLGYFPGGWPWGWLFPYACTREVIASTTTDACGRFCVWVPRFDIDWILRWRRERVCFPLLFDRPSWRDLIDGLIDRLPRPPVPGPGPWPGPGPGPGPFAAAPTPSGAARLDAVPDLPRLRQLAGSLDSTLADGLAQLETLRGRAFGESTLKLQAALDAPAPLSIAPPLPDYDNGCEPRALPQLARDSIAAELRLSGQALEGLHVERFVGPLRRCVDVFVPEWTPIVDVPDITFRVLQDTNGDGVEEQIYGESHFDVRWNATSLPFVTLEAGPQARTAPACLPGGSVPCGNTPALVLAGRLPLSGAPDTFDPGSGYGVRTNRPHASGVTAEPMNTLPARSPLYGKLPLLGCIRTHPNATHYRVLYRYKAPGSASFGASAPFVGLSWWLFRLGAGGVGQWHAPAADSSGWYPIDLPAGPSAWLPQDLVLDWPTRGFADGTYELVLQLGIPPGGIAASSAAVQIVVDNHAPAASFSVEWRRAGSAAWLPVGGECPTVRRGAVPGPIEFRVTLVTTSRHFRNAWFRPDGCEASSMSLLSGSGGSATSVGFEHWHTSAAQTGATLQAVYRLPGGTAEGSYGFWGRTVSRAFDCNEVNAPPLPAFEYDDSSPPVFRDFAQRFAVIDAD
jgi:hypothetical protein